MSLLLSLLLALAAWTPPDNLLPQSNAVCLECHSGQGEAVIAEVYNQSPHGVLECIRCHAEAEGPEHAKNPEAPLGIPKERQGLGEYSSRCVKCHAGVVTSYSRSFHGMAVSMGDLRAATCVDCHGSHDIYPAAAVNSLVHTANIPSTCGTADCHPGAPAGFAEGREHFDHMNPGGEGTDKALHWVWKFFVGLILFDTMKDGPIVMFELLRRIRG